MIDPSCARDRLVSLLRFAARLSGLALAVRPAALADFSDQGSLPVIASVSGNTTYRLCFRIFSLNCCTWSTLVHWRPLLSGAIVTQLVTRPCSVVGYEKDDHGCSEGCGDRYVCADGGPLV